MAIIEIKVPSPGESINEVELGSWLVEDDKIVQKNTEIAEIESNKATLTLIADETGQIKHLATEGDTLEVGTVACTIDTSVAPEEEETTPKVSHPKNETIDIAKAEEKKESKRIESDEFSKVKITSVAKQLMIEENLTVEDIINGVRRLKKNDILAVKQSIEENPNEQNTLKKEVSRQLNEKPMSSLRRKLSERLVAVKNETAMLTTFNEVDMSAIINLRKQYQDKFVAKHGIKLGFMSFFIKACSKALELYPNVNGMIDNNSIITHEYTDISVAVSTPKGLMVPVVRNVESLGLANIELKLKELAEKARSSKLSIPEMTGGTFTITNGGIFGSMLSTPIINPPQSAILGMHNIVERPIAENGNVVIRPMMYIALSYDHRIVDGRESVSFLVKVKEFLENPQNILWDKKNGEEILLEL